MIDIIEITFCKYKSGTCPHDGKIIWSKVFLSLEYQSKKKAIHRLVEYIENKDINAHSYILGNEVILRRELKDTFFNDPGIVVYSKAITSKKDFHKKAAQRLAKYLTKHNSLHNYYGGVPLKEIGENCYQLASRNTVILETSDKALKIKRTISGRKAALTRSINKAKKIRTDHQATLFPENYKDDTKFQKLLFNMKFQKKRVSTAKQMQIGDIEDSIGQIKGPSTKSFNSLLWKYCERLAS